MLSIEDMSAYEVQQLMQRSTKAFWAESDGQLYPAFTQLAKEELIACIQPKIQTVRKKKIYSITKNGMTALKQWLIQEPETLSVRNEAMLKLFFGSNIQVAENQEHVLAQQYQSKKLLAQLLETKKDIMGKYKESQHFPYWMMSIDFGIEMTEAKLRWCEKALRVLKKISRG